MNFFGKRANNDSGDDDEEMTLPIDPSHLLPALLGGHSKDDLKVDGNKVYFYKDVSRETILRLNTCLTEVAKRLLHLSISLNLNKRIPIYLFIHSNGGDAFAGFSAMDHIKHLPVPVYTIIDGMAASAATFIALSGEKRYIHKHSYALIHQIKTFFGGNYEELKDEMENSESMMDSIIDFYRENTKLSSVKLKEILKRDIYFTASQCMEYGLVDDIYNPNNLDDFVYKKPQKSNKRKRIVE